jgi:hypothetical protein
MGNPETSAQQTAGEEPDKVTEQDEGSEQEAESTDGAPPPPPDTTYHG